MEEFLEHRLAYWLEKYAQARKDPSLIEVRQIVRSAATVMELQYILHRQFGKDFHFAFDECPCQKCAVYRASDE
jgi:hypothetical protein